MSSSDDRSGPKRDSTPSGAFQRQVGTYGARARGQVTGAKLAVNEPTFGSGVFPLATSDESEAASAEAPATAPAPRPGGISFSESIDHAVNHPSGSFHSPHAGTIGRQTGSFATPSASNAVEVASFDVPPSGLVPRQSGALDGIGSGPVPRSSGAFGTTAAERSAASASGPRAVAGGTGAFRVVAPGPGSGAPVAAIPRGSATELLTAAMRTLTSTNNAIAAGEGDGFLLWGECMLANTDLEHVKPEHLPPDRADELTVVKAGLVDAMYDLRNAARTAFPEAEDLAAVVRAQLDVERVATERAAPLIAHRRAHHLPVLEKKPGSAGLAEALAVHAQMMATELEIVQARAQVWPLGLRHRLPAAEARKPTLDRALWKKLDPQIPRLFGAKDTHPTDLILRLIFVAGLGGGVAALAAGQQTLAWVAFPIAAIVLLLLLQRQWKADRIAEQAVAIQAADRAHFEARQAEGRHMERLLADIVAAEKVIPAVYKAQAEKLAADKPKHWAMLRELVARGAM